MKFIHYETYNQSFHDQLAVRLREFNDAHSPFHQAIRGVDLPSVQLKMEHDGEWVGGLSGQVYWGWFDIERVWISPEYRGRGFGTTLLKEAEARARELGASRVKLTTYSFQARTFYERLGYEVTGEMEDYPPGSTFYWMRKEL